jgi:drug/metabolite transporter (DMT)-like permease
MIAIQPFRPSPRRFLVASLPSSRALAVLALVLANAIWGGSAAATKTVLVHLPPLTTACVRVAIALAVLRLLLALRRDRPATGRAPAFLGLTGVAVFCASQNLGLRSASATTTALINGAIPVLTAILATVLLGERLSGWRLTGLLVSLSGIAILVLHGSVESLGVATLGNVLPLVSAASFAIYAVLGRQVFAGGNALAIVAGSTRYGLLFLVPCTFIELTRGDLGQVTGRDLALLLFLGAGCSAMAFVLAGYGLAHLDASQGAVLGNLKPLVGVGLAVFLLGEPLTGRQFGGGMLVLLGVGIASWLQRETAGWNGTGSKMATLLTEFGRSGSTLERQRWRSERSGGADRSQSRNIDLPLLRPSCPIRQLPDSDAGRA